MGLKIIRFNEIEEFRALEPTEDTGHIVEGYAIVYEQVTNVGGWFKEIIKRGALDGADLKDVPLFIHHNQRKIPLARSRNNNGNSTMQLTVDEKGLFFRAELDVENNSEAKALYSAIKRKDITGMSFSFRAKDEKWIELGSPLPTREIHKFEKVYEISALYSPQYEGTNINARSESLDSEDKLALDNARATELDSSDDEQLELEKIKLEIL
ncbi:HK97 family phage prohead protease [Gracilibacillus marinus]|uniref:HK97 family phage prohead protease n=1 Tax=Gracilibacillus marinus TaxID=630535 RepID=A0ABV8VX99_9BACI